MTEHPTSGRLIGPEHELPVRVYYEDTDFSGVVYHANYLKFFERGRSEYLRLVSNNSHRELHAREKPNAFVVSRMEIDFKRPARIDDALVVKTELVRIKGPRIIFSQRVEKDGELLASADVTVAQIDENGRPVRPELNIEN